MTNKLSLALGGFLALVLIAASLLFVVSGEQSAHAGYFNGTNISIATTTSSFSVTVSARILATTTSIVGTSYTRVYATICNNNANPVALNLDGDKATSLNGGAVTTWIAAAAGYNVCYEITDKNQYNGSITASSTSETSTKITVKDYVQ